MRPNNDNNVYVLGAGFSAEAGFPLVASFLSTTRDAIDWLDDNKRHEEVAAIERVLDFRHQAGSAGYRINVDLDNIEHLFSLAAAKPRAASELDIRLAIAATLDYCSSRSNPPIGRLRVDETAGWPVTDRLRKSAKRITGARSSQDIESSIYHYYAAFLSGLSSQKMRPGSNTIITLNYDLLLEESLRDLAIPIAYDLAGSGVTIDPTADINDGNASALRILKLHGSTNWGERADGSLIVHATHEGVRAGGLKPLLVPPTWNKNAAQALSRVWDSAVRSIAAATRLVLIGFSIPPYDQHFKYLLSVGLQDNSSLRTITIVDPLSNDLMPQYEAVFRSDQFNYGIVQTRRMKTAEFLYDPREVHQLGRARGHMGLQLVAHPTRGPVM